MDLQTPLNAAKLTKRYNLRFEKLLLSLDEALTDAGIKTDKELQIEASEQNESRRLLLVVEEQTNKKKEDVANAENEYLQGVEKQFNAILMADLETVFCDTELIMNKVLKLDKSLGQLLDLLYTQSCSISRIISCLQPLAWLEASIIAFVKLPQYRRLDSSGHPVSVKTIRSALSLIGIDSLRILLPVLIAKHANAVNSQFSPQIGKTMWLYTLGSGNIAKGLADKYGVKPHFAYTIGLFANIGRTAVISVYLRRFDIVLREEIIKARNKNDIKQAKALTSLMPSHKMLIDLWQRFASIISFDVIKSLELRWLMITPGLDDYAKIREADITHVNALNLHPLTRLLFTAQGFMQYKMLSKEKLIGKREAMVYLRNFGLTSSHISIISNLSITAIDLNIAGTVDKINE